MSTDAFPVRLDFHWHYIVMERIKDSCLLLFLCLAVSLTNGTRQREIHECDRACVAGQPPKTCTYHFAVEQYYTMARGCSNCPFNVEDCYQPQCVTGDGRIRTVVSVNRQVPGPPIRVCHGDTVEVYVYNYLDAGTTIHWHGMQQRGTPYSDGNYMITQCPIGHGQMFKYKFTANPSGTFMWHSHVNPQLTDGMYGSFVVADPPSKDPHHSMLSHDCDTPSGDCEYVALLDDWFDTTAIERFMRLLRYGGPEDLPTSGVVNGRSGLVDVQHKEDPARTARTPWEVFDVIKGKKYRFRVINLANMECPFKVSVDGHMLTIIAADGQPIEPTVVDTFIINSGERYDFILAASETVDNYWFKALGMIACQGPGAHGYAIVRYSGAAMQEPTGEKEKDRQGKLLNPLIFLESTFPTAYHGGENDINYVDLNSTENVDLTDEKVDTKLYIGMTMRPNDENRFSEPMLTSGVKKNLVTQLGDENIVLNNISFILPTSPVMSQFSSIPEESFCNEDTLDVNACHSQLCACTHRVKIPLGHTVEIILVDEGGVEDDGHPIYMHGFTFYVIGWGRFGKTTNREVVKEKDKAGLLPRKLIRPSSRDTVMVPDGGYVILRFKADNPGVWALHCHREFHMLMGQMMLLQVGENKDWPPVPKGFPWCGSPAPCLPKPTKWPPYSGGGSTALLPRLLETLAIMMTVYMCIMYN